MLIQHVFDEKQDKLGELSQQDCQLIKDLVKGDSSNYARHNPTKRFLFDIVSNKRNSFDLDKLDYLNRDLKHT